MTDPPPVVHRTISASGRRRTLALVLGGIVALKLAVLGIVGWIGSERAIHPRRIQEEQDLPDYDFAGVAQTVRFPSLDGTSLAGWFIPAGQARAAAVILLHGYGNSRPQLLPHADYLHRAGYHVLLIDFRNRGESGGDVVTIGAMEPLDVRGAVSYLRTRAEVDPARIAVQGVSLGASAGILAAVFDQRIAAVVAESAFTDLAGTIARSFTHFIGLPSFPFTPVTLFIAERRLGARAANVRPVDAIRDIGGRPVLLIDGLQDDIVPPNSGRRLYAAAPGPKELWLIEDAGHAGGLKAQPEAYPRRVLRFYAEHLRRTPPGPGP